MAVVADDEDRPLEAGEIRDRIAALRASVPALSRTTATPATPSQGPGGTGGQTPANDEPPTEDLDPPA